MCNAWLSNLVHGVCGLAIPTRDSDSRFRLAIPTRCDSHSVHVSHAERGEVFGWGNSEYGQLTAAAGGEMQVNSPLRLPLPDGVGRVTKVVAAGSMCAALNGEPTARPQW